MQGFLSHGNRTGEGMPGQGCHASPLSALYGCDAYSENGGLRSR